jgi:nucleoside-diphosphate-sugar epimerase
MAAGYSGTPLAKKLGIKDGFEVVLLDEPPTFRRLLDPVPEGVAFSTEIDGRCDVVVSFATERAVMERQRAAIADAIFPAGSWWMAWPKKASKVPTDITEDVVREVVVPHGLVDVKVCAIDDVWSGLRVVHRKERRS